MFFFLLLYQKEEDCLINLIKIFYHNPIRTWAAAAGKNGRLIIHYVDTILLIIFWLNCERISCVKKGFFFFHFIKKYKLSVCSSLIFKQINFFFYILGPKFFSFIHWNANTNTHTHTLWSYIFCLICLSLYPFNATHSQSSLFIRLPFMFNNELMWVGFSVVKQEGESYKFLLGL